MDWGGGLIQESRDSAYVGHNDLRIEALNKDNKGKLTICHQLDIRQLPISYRQIYAYIQGITRLNLALSSFPGYLHMFV